MNRCLVCLVGLAGLLQAETGFRVAADGTGTHRSISEALAAVPRDGITAFEIRIAPGIHRGKITIPREHPPVILRGESAATTILEWDDFSGREIGPEKPGGKPVVLGTGQTATLAVEADDCSLHNLTIANTHGKGSQAVALAISGRRTIVADCRLKGWQDTLYLRGGDTWLGNTTIEGHCDFIFGGGRAWFEGCVIHCLEAGFITAASTSPEHEFGFVFHRCRITAPEGAGWKTYLGRPWKPEAAVAWIQCEMAGVIHPGGWDPWGKEENKTTARFSEFGSTGPGANAAARVPWSKSIEPLALGSITPWRVLGSDPALGIRASRLAGLSPDRRAAWADYVRGSRSARAKEAAILESEMKSAGLAEPLIAPSGKDFRFQDKAGAAAYTGEAAEALVSAMIGFQSPTGGWAKAVAYDKGPRRPGMRWNSHPGNSSPWHYIATLDNNSTIAQIRHLARFLRHHPGRRDVEESIHRAFDWLKAAEFPDGGWPQVYPLEGAYHDNLTLNDNALLNVLALLEDIRDGDEDFGFLDGTRRAELAAMRLRALALVPRLQVRINNRPTVWAAQHDPISHVPAPARLKEPPALSGAESANLVKFLMTLEDAPPEIHASIRSAIAWFESSSLTAGEQEGADTDGGPQWARFYDPVTAKPIFPGSDDGILYPDWKSMKARNRVAYEFVSDRPEEVIGKLRERWEKMLAKGKTGQR